MTKAPRIASCFARLKAASQTGLVAYLPVGYPTLQETPALVSAVIEGGASIVELGVPFSDPLADGATIQRATAQALGQGVRLADCLEVAARTRDRHPGVPLVFMGYYNTFLSYGLESFCDDAAQAGADGAIVVDLPPEEADAFRDCSAAAGLDLIFLLAPTSTEARIKKVASVAQGFIYCVSVSGVTGARAALPEYLPAFIAGVRAQTQLPLAIGFGVSLPEHVQAIGRFAEAAVVGSALVDVIDRSQPGERASGLRAFVAGLVGVSTAKSRGDD